MSGQIFFKNQSNLIYGTMYFIQDSERTILLKRRLKNLSVPHLIHIFIDLYCIGDTFDLPQCGPPPHWPCGGPCPLLGAVPFQSSVWADEGVGAQKWPTGYFILLPLKIDFILNDKITNLLNFLQLQSA